MIESGVRAERSVVAARAEVTPVLHYLVELAGRLYAFPQSGRVALSWVQRPQEPTYLPTLPSWCLGLVAERNTPVLLIDPRALLGLPPADRADDGENARHARHVFLECDGETIGLLVDRTHRFRLLQPARSAAPDGQFVVEESPSDEQAVRTLDVEAIWRFALHELGAP